MHTLKTLLVCFLSWACSCAYASAVYTKSDSLIFERYIEHIAPHRNKPIADVMIYTVKYFLGKPYVAYTLENNLEKEVLTINLKEFDCTTFVETCIALSRTAKSEDLSFSNFCNELQCIRYRSCLIEDYSSRLHYVSDWIIEHEKKNILTDLSKNIGGKHRQKQINFMSTHTDSYVRLKDNTPLQAKIKKMERELNQKGGDYVLNKELITNKSNYFESGDIVVFSTSIAGIDFSHIGIIYNDSDRLTFIHASSKAKKVVIDEKTLSDYCQSSKLCDGVVLLRLKDI